MNYCFFKHRWELHPEWSNPDLVGVEDRCLRCAKTRYFLLSRKRWFPWLFRIPVSKNTYQELRILVP